MNDDLTPELLASGYIDDALSDDERALVEADPTLRALADAHAAARDAVAQGVSPLTAGEREGLLARALAGAGDTGVGATATARDAAHASAVAPLELLGARRARRHRRFVQAGAALAAAAVIATIGLAVTRPGSHQGQGSSSATEAPGSAPSSVRSAAGSAADQANPSTTIAAPGTTETFAAAGAPASAAPVPEGATGGPAPVTAAAAGRDASASPLPDLGSLENRTQFIAAVRRFAHANPGGQGATAPCPAYPPPLATATFKATPAYLVVLRVAPGGDQLALVARGSCDVLVKVDLAEQ
jgi:hypothetical protein